MSCKICEINCLAIGLLAVMLLTPVRVLADKVVVIPLNGSAKGNATVADVLKGRTFSSKAGKGLTGTLEQHPMGLVFITPIYLTTFNLIPAGSFTMGSPVSEPGHDTDEEPLVATTISRPFYMMVNEVSQWQWGLVVAAGEYWGHLTQGELNADPSSFKNPAFPVTDVTYNEVTKWIATLNLLDGRTNCTGTLHESCYRLPTEAEWEYAARAGTTTAYANQYNFDPAETETGAGFNANLAAMGWYAWNDTNHNYLTGPKPVMRKQANSWGLYDMHGNVWEYCRDWYGYDYYGDAQRPAVDPTGPPQGFNRVVRGGSYSNHAWRARSASRGSFPPDAINSSHGFRLVLPSGQ